MSATESTNAAIAAMVKIDRDKALKLERAAKVMNDAICEAKAAGLTVQVVQDTVACMKSPSGEHFAIRVEAFRQVMAS